MRSDRLIPILLVLTRVVLFVASLGVASLVGGRALAQEQGEE